MISTIKKSGIFIILIYVFFLPLPKHTLAQVNCGQLNQECCPPAGNAVTEPWCSWGLTCQGNICISNSTPLKGDCIDTAIGCVPIGQQGFVSFILRWAIGIASGIAFFLIVIASFQIMTSQGDPKKLQAGQELLTSAIMGLLLLIFSAFILRIIGVNILQIPGLS